MAVFEPDQFRNIVLVGHTGAGKTSLAEALLFKAGVTNRLGSVQDGSSILDTTEEEKEKLSSLESAICYLTHTNLHVNILDTPGSAAFCGHAIEVQITHGCQHPALGARADAINHKLYETLTRT